MWKEGVVFVPFGYNWCRVSAGAHRSALGLEVLRDCSKLLWERMFMLGSDKCKAPTRAAPQVFPDICAGHKQLKPACIPPVGPYPTTSSPHSHPLVSWMCWSTMTPTSPSLPGAKMPLGSLLQGDKWPEAETCSLSAPHHLAGEGTQCSNQSKQRSKRCLKHPSPSKPVPVAEWKGRGITVLAIPQIPSPSEGVNPAFKSRLPPASSPPDVARHPSLRRLTYIFNVVIFWLWQLYRHRDYKRVTSMQWAADEPHVKKPLCHRDEDSANKHFWGTLSP